MLVNPSGVAISHFSQPLSSTNEQYVRNSILNKSTRFFFFCDQELLSFCWGFQNVREHLNPCMLQGCGHLVLGMNIGLKSCHMVTRYIFHLPSARACKCIFMCNVRRPNLFFQHHMPLQDLSGHDPIIMINHNVDPTLWSTIEYQIQKSICLSINTICMTPERRRRTNWNCTRVWASLPVREIATKHVFLNYPWSAYMYIHMYGFTDMSTQTYPYICKRWQDEHTKGAGIEGGGLMTFNHAHTIAHTHHHTLSLEHRCVNKATYTFSPKLLLSVVTTRTRR